MKVLIVDEMHESILSLLEKEGIQAKYEPKISREEIIRTLGDYDGLIIRSKTEVNEDLIKNAGTLRFVARAGAGIDKIDLTALEKRNITLINSPEGNRDALGEHTVGMLLSLLNNIYRAHRSIKKGHWLREPHRGTEIKGKTVGIIGFGNMGSAFAQRLMGFECTILAFDKYKTGFATDYVRESTLEEIKSKANILSLHVPLTGETRSMVNKSFITDFEKPLYLINSARGEIVCHKDVLELLDNGKILGACLDVFENENIDKLTDEQQLVYETLYSKPNVIMTPHIAGWSFESNIRINEVLVGKIKKLQF